MLKIIVKTRPGMVEVWKENGTLVEELPLTQVMLGDEIHINLSKEAIEAYIVDNGDLEGITAD